MGEFPSLKLVWVRKILQSLSKLVEVDGLDMLGSMEKVCPGKKGHELKVHSSGICGY
jgi:hypothetical protein